MTHEDQVEQVPPIVSERVYVWCDALAAGDVDAVWFLMDKALQTAIAQSWLFDNRANPTLEPYQPLDEFASLLVEGPPVGGAGEEIWAGLMQGVLRRLSAQGPPFPRDRWGMTSNRRPAGDDLEVVLIVDNEEITEFAPHSMALLGPELARPTSCATTGKLSPRSPASRGRARSSVGRL